MQKSWQHWLAKRFKYSGIKQLSQKDILVFIYRQGYLYLILILITFVAGINYANNLILAFCFLISAVLCVSFYLTFKQLHGLEVEIRSDEIGQVGHSVYMDLYFKQAGAINRYLYIQTDHGLEKLLLKSNKQMLRLAFDCQTRGQFDYPIIQIYAIYPFGLVRAWTYLYHHQQAWIAPKAEFYQGDHQSYHSSFEPDLDEFRELRNYRLGDSLQAVSWKQVARGQGLYVKVFEQHQDEQRLEIYYEHMPSQSHEQRLALMMGLVEQCEQGQFKYSLHLPQTELAQGLGELQLQRAKQLLAQA